MIPKLFSLILHIIQTVKFVLKPRMENIFSFFQIRQEAVSAISKQLPDAIFLIG